MALAPKMLPASGSGSLRARPAALLRNYSERIFKPPVETPQCGQAFCQACKRAKQTRCADHAADEASLPTVLPAIDRSIAARERPSRSNSAPQLVTAYVDCPRTTKRHQPISSETLKLLRAGMRSSCKCWLHEYLRPFLMFLALSDLYAFLKANVNQWPRRFPNHLPESFQLAMLRLITPEYLQCLLVAVCWVVYQLVCGYQSSLFSHMGAITTLKSRTRFSRAILEGAKLAWVSFIAAAWQISGMRSPGVINLCLRMISALTLALLCTWTCHHRVAIKTEARRFTKPAYSTAKKAWQGVHDRRRVACIVMLLLLLGTLILAPGLSQSEQSQLAVQLPAAMATRTRDVAVADAVSAARPVNGPAYMWKGIASGMQTVKKPEETRRVFAQYPRYEDGGMLFDPW